MNNDNNQTPVGAQTTPTAPLVNDFQTQSTPPSPIAGTSAGEDKAPKKSGGSMGKMLTILLVIILAAGVGAGAYYYGKSKAPIKEVTKLVTAPDLTVPKGATVISQCAKGKGTLYALPKDIPTGPVYMVNKGKVIGIEFMVGKDDLLVAGKSLLNLSLYHHEFDHVNIGLLSQGHAGFPVPHYHVDIFSVSDTVATAITCAV